MIPRQSSAQPARPTPPPRQEIKFSTVSEAAEILRLSKMSVYRMVREGALPGYRFGQTIIRIPTAAVWKYVHEHRIDPDLESARQT